MDLQKLRGETVKEIVPTLNNLDAAQLAELLAMEEADKDPRSTLVEAIKAAQAALEAEQKPAGAPPAAETKAGTEQAKADAAGKAKPKAEAIPVTDFRHPEYNGPLDGGQAAWRNANLKPAAGGVNK